MSTVTESVDVDVPIKTAYDQWTQNGAETCSGRASDRRATPRLNLHPGDQGLRRERGRVRTACGRYGIRSVCHTDLIGVVSAANL